MKLSDVMGAANLALYAEVALVIFFVVFVLLAWHVLHKGKAEWEHARHLPLDDPWRDDDGDRKEESRHE